MSSALYRTYRPQTFTDVVDQAPIKLTLQNEILLKRPGHAYVFSGPRGVGKTSLARIFAKSLNCEGRQEGSAEPCNQCLSCIDITEGRHPDVVEIDAASHTGVDHVRSAIIEYARFAPQRGGYKLFIIDEVHMLSTSAFNALLKTLEEPPERVMFVLATTELHKLPDTIISRCERFDFKTIHPTKIAERLGRIAELEGVTIDQEVLRQIGVRSGGYLRDAESMMGQVLGLGKKTITAEDTSLVLPKGNLDAVRHCIEALYRLDAKSCVEGVLKFHEEGVDMKSLLIDITSALREIALHQVGGNHTPLFDDYFGREDSEQFMTLFSSRVSSFTISALDHCIAVFEYFRHPVPEYAIVELGLLKSIVGHEQAGMREEFVSSSIRDKQVTPHFGSKTRSTISLSSEEVSSKWGEVVESCSTLNPSLKLMLGGANPTGVEAGVFQLAVGYDLHVQKLSDTKTLTIVEGVLERVYGQPFRLRVEHVQVQNQQQVGSENDVLVNDLMKNFGAVG